MLQDTDLNEKVGLISGETYIMFNNLRGYITVWINCDKDMSVNISKDDLIKIAPTLFPAINLSELLRMLQRGSYIFTDKFTIKQLKSTKEINTNILPSFNDVSRSMSKNKAKLQTPFGLTF